MANHTPGPWYKISKFDYEICDNRWHISQSPEGGPYWIAELFGELPRGQEEANACLIAAAPDLLIALKEEHGWDDPLHIAAQPDCWKCAAIAKAEGKEVKDV